MTGHAIETKCSVSGFVISIAISLWENHIITDISWHFLMGAVGGLGAWVIARILNKFFNKKK